MTDWIPTSFLEHEFQESLLRNTLQILNNREVSMTITHNKSKTSYVFSTKKADVEIINAKTICLVSKRSGNGIELDIDDSKVSASTKEMIKTAYGIAASLVAEYTHPGT